MSIYCRVNTFKYIPPSLAYIDNISRGSRGYI